VAVVPAEGAAGDAGYLGFETLTLAPIDRTLIDTTLLNENEIAWLDSYHARVFEALSARLPAPVAWWLETATGPLG
jgi:Xaa-Pro aminopeptidase